MARRLGAHFISGEKVVELRKIKGAARQVVTASGNVYEDDKIILAAGYESRFIASTVGIDVPMQPVLLETLVTEAVGPMFWQMLGTADADFYGHQTEHGSFVFGLNSGLEPYAKPGKPLSSSIAASQPAAVLCIISLIWQTSRSPDVGWLDGRMCRPCAGHQQGRGSAGTDSGMRLYRTWLRHLAGSWTGTVTAGNGAGNSSGLVRTAVRPFSVRQHRSILQVLIFTIFQVCHLL